MGEHLDLANKHGESRIKKLIKKMGTKGRDETSNDAFDEAHDLLKFRGPKKEKKMKDIKRIREYRKARTARLAKWADMAEKYNTIHEHNLYNDYKIMDDMDQIKDMKIAKLNDIKQEEEVNTRIKESDFRLAELKKDLADRV